ncbi:MAG: class I SAM-dependent RNA methyltransferase [Acidobacteriia bacterium]|nr:class I SAM-dependent RNA methyltransferase [Terriglobia bacterium]
MPKSGSVRRGQECPRYTYDLLLSIEKLIYGGNGLARTPPGADGRSMAVFVPFVLPGEKIEAEIRQEKPGFARGSVAQLIVASSDRVEARCPYFRQCGGCHYQHIPYERQLEFKAGILRETLQRIAKIELTAEIRLHPSPPWNYRNRTRLQVRTIPEFALGYFRFGSHEFLPVSECPISSPLLNRMMARLVELGGLNCPAAVEEIELFADAADEHLLAWAFCGREADQKDLLRWAEALQRELPGISGVTFFSSRRRGEEDEMPDPKALAQAGARAIRYRTVGDQTKEHEYQVSAGAFFQANRHLIDELVSVVTGNVRGDLALDLYAGVGLFSAALAIRFHHIFAVEASQTSHADLMQNVPANVKAVGARTEDYLRNGSLRSDDPRRRPVRNRPDLIVLDPPRAGGGKAVIRSLVELGAPRVRYVSCDPATLARDLAPLLAAGYHVEEAHLFDLFPQTFHIESVMLLAR